jgi:hypothetical protein
VVDAAGRTTRPGLFAAGNVVRGAETADVAALEGRHVAGAIIARLGGAPWPAATVPVRCEPPLAWIAPNAVAAGDLPPARGRHLLRAREELLDARVEFVQDGRRRHLARVPRVMPGRSARLDPGWTRAVDPSGGPVTARVISARRSAR